MLRSKLGCPYFLGIGMYFCPLCCTDLVYSFSSEVELCPYTPAACSVMTLWAKYKVVLVALPVAVRVLPQLLPRSSMSMIRTCPEAPFVRPPLMDVASELRAGLVVKHTGEKRCLLCVLIYVLFTL